MQVRIEYPQFSALDDNGIFAVGYEIHTYEAGTSTPLITYSNRTLTTPNTNPVILDVRGEALIYVDQAAKLIFTIPGGDPGDPIREWDYIGEMQANFVTGSATPTTINNNYVVTTVPAVPALSNNFMLIMTPDVDNVDTIVSNTFTGTGSNDCIASGPYIGSDSGAIFAVEIDGALEAPPGAPTAVENVAAGLVTAGDHYVKVSLVTAIGETVPGTRTPVVECAESKKIDLSSVPLGSAQVLSRNIYMTKAGPASIAPALTTPNWTLGSGWRYDTSPNRLDKYQDGTGTATPAAATGIVAGTTYKVVITVDSITGTGTYTLGGAAGTTLAAAATYTDYITAVSTGELIITPVATGFRVIISVISIKAIPTAYYYVDEIADNLTEIYTISIADASLTVAAPTTDTTGIADTYTWKKDTVVGGTGLPIVEGSQILIEGVTITWATTTGHVLGDIWAIEVETPARVNLDGLSDPHGLVVYKNKGGYVVALDGSDMIAGYPAQLILNEAGNHWLLMNPATPIYSTTTISAIRYRKNLTADYQLVIDDQGRELSCVGTFTLTLTTASVFANRFVYISNLGTGIITIDAGAYNIYGMGDVVGASTFSLVEGISIQLVSNGVDWHILTDTALRGGYQVFTSSGTFTVPRLCTNVLCMVQASGASGAGGNGYSGGGGGGGGGMTTALITGLTPGTSISVTVGAGGVAVAAATDGNDGNDSSFGSYLTAKKGLKGYKGTSEHTGIGGAGGGQNYQTSILVIGAQNGGAGGTADSEPGAAGGPSGSNAPGGDAGVTGAGGAGSPYGGGGGGGNGGNTPNYGSGAGADGVVVVWWNY